MRNLLLFSLCTALVCGTASASRTDRKMAPAYLTPGAEPQIRLASSIMSKGKANIQKRRQTRKTTPSLSAPHARILGTALDANPRSTISRDTLLVTSLDYIDENSTENQYTISYDKYGYRTLMSQPEKQTRYTYNVDNSGRWLSRIVETKEQYDPDWMLSRKEERTIENDHVTSVTIYDVWGTTAVKMTYQELEYGHGGEADVNGNLVPDAAITKAVSYNEDGSIYSEANYKWIDLAHDYILTSSFDPYSKAESKIFDDHILTSHYNNNSGNWTLAYASAVYYGTRNGEVFFEYDSNGNTVQTNCSVYECYTSTAGDSTVIEYDYIDGALTPKTKYEYSADYVKDTDYSADFNQISTTYEYIDGEWVKTDVYGITHHIRPDGLSEITQYDSRYTNTIIAKIEKIDSEYGPRWKISPVTLNSDGSYIVTISDDDDYDTYLYEYYSAAGVLQKTVKQSPVEGIDDAVTFMVMTPANPEWKPLDEYSITQSQGSISMRAVYRTGSDGKPLSYTEYVTYPGYNGGKEFKSLETLYSYRANGDYTVETYEVYSPLDISKLIITEKVECLTLADGTIQTTEIEYDEDGKGTIDYGTRTEYKDFVRRSYTYDSSTSSWRLDSTWCETEEYTTPDGTEVRIERRISDDGTYAIYSSKSEYKEINSEDNSYRYRMDASYDWDEDNKRWVGNYKSESSDYNFEFPTLVGNFDPIKLYNDEYMVIPEESTSIRDTRSEYFSNNYEWNTETNDWNPVETGDFSFTMSGDVLTTKKTKMSTRWGDKETQTTTEIIERDELKREVRRESFIESVTERPDSENEKSFTHSADFYKYNNETGLLEEHKYVDYDEAGEPKSTRIFRYTYTPMSIEVSAIEDIANDSNLSVNGLEISCPGQLIRIYAINGILISATADNATLPSAPGVYIVKAANAVRKIAIR